MSHNKTDKAKNEKIRKRFLRWYKSHYKPELKEMSKVIGLSNYPDFINWKNGKRNFGNELLSKVEEFLENVENYE